MCVCAAFWLCIFAWVTKYRVFVGAEEPQFDPTVRMQRKTVPSGSTVAFQCSIINQGNYNVSNWSHCDRCFFCSLTTGYWRKCAYSGFPLNLENLEKWTYIWKMMKFCNFNINPGKRYEIWKNATGHKHLTFISCLKVQLYWSGSEIENFLWSLWLLSVNTC